VKQYDRGNLYHQMLRVRLFEEMIQDLWDKGLISGEMHLGIGEEGVIIGVLDHFKDGDALLLDHRSTPALVARGVSLRSMLLEMFGSKNGLCAGQGGHMHMFSPEHLAASSGIVGASGPLAAGFALAAQHLRPGRVAVAFFGEGAMNQGMLMESMNLAVAWKLPVIFVCKDNNWAITTRRSWVTGGNLLERAHSFGLSARQVRGTDVTAVWKAARKAVAEARRGHPAFLLARCSHKEGHFLGDPLLLMLRKPIQQMVQIAPGLVKAFFHRHGAAIATRMQSVGTIMSTLGVMGAGHWFMNQDPLVRARRRLDPDFLQRTESEVRQEMEHARTSAQNEWGKECAQWQS